MSTEVVTSPSVECGDVLLPRSQHLVLASVSYSIIVLTDTTNGGSVNLGDQSRAFFAV